MRAPGKNIQLTIFGAKLPLYRIHLNKSPVRTQIQLDGKPWEVICSTAVNM